jgi:hypothetical protein
MIFLVWYEISGLVSTRGKKLSHFVGVNNAWDACATRGHIDDSALSPHLFGVKQETVMLWRESDFYSYLLVLVVIPPYHTTKWWGVAALVHCREQTPRPYTSPLAPPRAYGPFGQRIHR